MAESDDKVETESMDTEVTGAYYQYFMEFIEKAKQEIFRHKISHHFPDDVAQKAEELWAQTCPQLSTAIDQRIADFMKTTSTEKKFLQLEEMKRSANDGDENASAGDDPKDISEDIVDSPMAEFIAKYEEQLLKSQNTKEELIAESERKMEILDDLTEEIECLLTQVENEVGLKSQD
ncbi:PREDICTED: uncharacterized protein LOC100632446 [Amphimedon queenslandica]|nr:PREDICTED: uncharacterized protein LOC100632446 [Amphimedon queenslandica]|eukprot:XP_003384819.1 PREDICTED: uncharacterized protein LOC100632446 [Amphimedon queenslandica]